MRIFRLERLAIALGLLVAMALVVAAIVDAMVSPGGALRVASAATLRTLGTPSSFVADAQRGRIAVVSAAGPVVVDLESDAAVRPAVFALEQAVASAEQLIGPVDPSPIFAEAKAAELADLRAIGAEAHDAESSGTAGVLPRLELSLNELAGIPLAR
ncbi:MAG: hypothetical protein ACYCXY_11615 [Acidimicrobiales bacterium]